MALSSSGPSGHMHQIWRETRSCLVNMAIKLPSFGMLGRPTVVKRSSLFDGLPQFSLDFTVRSSFNTTGIVYESR